MIVLQVTVLQILEKPEQLTYKLQFYKLLEIRVDNLRKAGYLVIIVGDINTSHHKIDHCDPYEVLIYYLCIYYILLNKYILIILTYNKIHWIEIFLFTGIL